VPEKPAPKKPEKSKPEKHEPLLGPYPGRRLVGGATELTHEWIVPNAPEMPSQPIPTPKGPWSDFAAALQAFLPAAWEVGSRHLDYDATVFYVCTPDGLYAQNMIDHRALCRDSREMPMLAGRMAKDIITKIRVAREEGDHSSATT
jgi:hypothetical protein